MANRMPDLAERHLGGHGVVFIGIDNRQVVGAEKVDGAVLHDGLEPYLGVDGPGWDYVYVDHPDGLVLAIVVNPPKWGDRIHACRKEYSADDGSLTVRDGDVFVRVPGKTRPATSSDLADLERRRDRSPSMGAQIRVDYDGAFSRIDTNSAVNLAKSVIDAKAAALLAELPSRASNNPYGIKIPTMAMDDRSADEFREGVETWRAEAHAKAPDVATEFLRHQLARGRWMIHNESVRYLEAVRVQVDFPPGVTPLMRSDTDYCDHGGRFNFLSLLPQEPKKWGSRLFVDSLWRPKTNVVGSAAFARDVEVVTDPRSGRKRVTWEVGDLRPGTTETGGELFAIVTDEHISELSVSWRCTARGVNHVFEGQTILTCAQEPASHLHWGPVEAADSPA